MPACPAHQPSTTTAGVERVVVMRTPNDYRNTSREKLLRRAAESDNVTIFCSSNFVGHIHEGELSRAREIVAEIGKNLAAGRCAGIGEVGLRHYDKRWATGGGQHEVAVPLDHPVMHQVLALANAHAVPVLFHIEPVYRPNPLRNRL